MQHFIKKAAALVMTLAMVLSLASVAFAADFPDMPDADHWSTTALEAAVENGLLSGKDGMIAGSAELTRAELATIITRAFAAEVEDDISFTDINSDTWYKTYAAKAVHMGAMTGKGDAFAGAAPVTRQEVMLVLARVLKLADGDAADLAAFSDADKTAAWAVPGVAALVKAGYVSGSNGALNPTSNITRAEFAQVMYNIFNNAYITEAGTVEEVNGKNVIISSTNVTVKGVDIEGDVVIADGVGDGDVFFEDVTIGGRLVVRGGGVNSIHFKSSKVTTAILAKVDGNVRLVIEEESTVEVVSVEDGKASTDVCVVGIVGSVVVNNATSTVVLDNATVESVEVNAANATVSLSGKTTVTLMTVAESAGETQLQAQPESVITKLETSVDVFINDESVIKDCNDEEKINPERPEESEKPAESGKPVESDGEFVESTGHSHTFKLKSDSTETEWTQYDAKQHKTTCEGSAEGVTYCGATIYRNHNFVVGAANTDKAGKTYCEDCGFVSKIADAEAEPSNSADSCGGTHDWAPMESAQLTEFGKTNKDATCTENGEKWYYCRNEVPTADPAAREAEEGDNSGNGGGGDQGNTPAAPKTCKATKVETTPATGHSYDRTKALTSEQLPDGSNITIKAATCVTPGVKAYGCTKCMTDGKYTAVIAETIAATGNHSAKTADGAVVWVTTGENKHWIACGGDENCTYKFREGTHTWKIEKIVTGEGESQTVDATNHKKTCTTCNKVVETEVHTFPEGGNTCTGCGYVKPGESPSPDPSNSPSPDPTTSPSESQSPAPSASQTTPSEDTEQTTVTKVAPKAAAAEVALG